MKKMLFTALVAACAMTACGTKTTETATAEELSLIHNLTLPTILLV